MGLCRKSALCLLWGIACLVPGLVEAKKVWIDGVLLRVQDQILTLSGFDKRLALAKKELERPLAPGEEKGFRDDLLNGLLEEMMVQVRAKELGYTVSKSDLDRALDSIRERNKLPDMEAVYRAAEQSGLTKETLHEQFSRQILMERVMQSEVFPQKDVTEWEIQEYYKQIEKDFMIPDQYHLKVLALMKPAARATQAAEVQKGIAAGVPFGTLVEQYSEAPSKEAGGDIGLVSPEDLTVEMRDAVKALQPGQISPPVEMRGGLYFAQLVEVVPAHPRPFAEVKDQVVERFNRDKYKDKIRSYLDDLKKRYHIVMNTQLLEEPK